MNYKEELLWLIQDLGELIPGIETPYEYTRRIKNSARYGSGTYKVTLSRLKKEKLVKTVKHHNKSVLVLTEKGKQLLRKRAKLKRREDGLSTVVIFDIPVAKNRERTIIRRYLVRNGFVLLQKSVLIGPYKIGDELKDLVKELGVENFLTVIAGKVDHGVFN